MPQRSQADLQDTIFSCEAVYWQLFIFPDFSDASNMWSLMIDAIALHATDNIHLSVVPCISFMPFLVDICNISTFQIIGQLHLLIRPLILNNNAIDCDI